MKSYTGPLLIVAAALVWNGSATYMASSRGRADDFAIYGSIVSVALLRWGVIETIRGR